MDALQRREIIIGKRVTMISGKKEIGVGYLELTGYAAPFQSGVSFLESNMVLKSEDNEIKYLCEIEAEPIYLEAHFSPEADKYVFAYTIRILNTGGTL